MSNNGWKDIPEGGLILEAGNSIKYETGSWRTYKPVTDMEKCIHCLFCWMYCPDSSRIVKDGKLVDTDLFHCKGCGVCAKECPKKCIEMVLEE
ncbi:MAG: 4Fe-4S binding protein [Candidatus Coatesbacteria bacterium]|nr:4Fe-4S binding protein [Candidatus Coatesbacteria bacterium]